MSICYSTESPTGEHRLEWRSTFTGGGYWTCLNSGCGETEHGYDEHNGG